VTDISFYFYSSRLTRSGLLAEETWVPSHRYSQAGLVSGNYASGTWAAAELIAANSSLV
jgi:hypothetical protein